MKRSSLIVLLAAVLLAGGCRTATPQAPDMTAVPDNSLVGVPPEPGSIPTTVPGNYIFGQELPAPE